MSKIDPSKIRASGKVIAEQTCGFYKVRLENGMEVLATMAAKFRVSRPTGTGTMKPRIYEGDRVVVEIPLNQSKLEKGIIVGFGKG